MQVGDRVYIRTDGSQLWSRAVVTAVLEDTVEVQREEGPVHIRRDTHEIKCHASCLRPVELQHRATRTNMCLTHRSRCSTQVLEHTQLGTGLALRLWPARCWGTFKARSLGADRSIDQGCRQETQHHCDPHG